MALPDSSLNILTVCVKELTFCSESSASSKPHPTTGHPSYGPSGDASEQWVKMEMKVLGQEEQSSSTTLWDCTERNVWNDTKNLLTVKEYHCLMQLLCPDFPMELTQKAARIVLMDDAMDCLMSFSDFLFAFQIQFYYSEFLESVAAIYQDLLTGKNPNTVIVPTSSSGQHRSRLAPSECSPLDGVEASLFYHCLESLCDRSKYSCPPSALVKEVLSSVQRLTFYGFLMALAKHHGINRALGALPDKGDLLLDPPMDQELEKLLSQVSGVSISTPAGSSGDIANLPTRTSPRISSPWKPLHHHQKVNTESDGSTDETESSEN
ncbi:centriolar satellite-associated tubulin polyglutamylase complex regulator 1 isoform X2 [Malaclemys terrapin pileata]|uniref:centriolar satellite-associated tubulin polyglutamylase complex regulator 1 isoform X2 n=1 Tax=Malaclemys terrapin pileata TaxID=2991368 RepID=UPI0023A880C7|nr:centriolar satellite-associated tubulin polyglutamylase complex regulator 1 isoform X2 [Malaclemys terrapin pileata]XP_053884272.1 centriolar satellite-associated tubulin polyglutamylase complex regulator 1 isoform X2 [Malaclemys terrapin pileata]